MEVKEECDMSSCGWFEESLLETFRTFVNDIFFEKVENFLAAFPSESRRDHGMAQEMRYEPLYDLIPGRSEYLEWTRKYIAIGTELSAKLGHGPGGAPSSKKSRRDSGKGSSKNTPRKKSRTTSNGKSKKVTFGSDVSPNVTANVQDQAKDDVFSNLSKDIESVSAFDIFGEGDDQEDGAVDEYDDYNDQFLEGQDGDMLEEEQYDDGDEVGEEFLDESNIYFEDEGDEEEGDDETGDEGQGDSQFAQV